MEFSPRQKKATMLVFLLCSPWLLCQAWIAVGAPDEAFTSMPVCSENSGNCAHLGGDAMYRMDGDYTLILKKFIEILWISNAGYSKTFFTLKMIKFFFFIISKIGISLDSFFSFLKIIYCKTTCF